MTGGQGLPLATEDGVGWGRSGGLQDSSSAGTLPPMADSAAASWDAARSCPALSRRQASAPRSLHAAEPALSLVSLLLEAPAGSSQSPNYYLQRRHQTRFRFVRSMAKL